MSGKITLPATLESWEQVYNFLNENLDSMDCSEKVKTQVLIAAEEIYVNIARYAYKEGGGTAAVEISREEDTGEITIVFTDSGVCYNPLERSDPDITLSADEREIGGLGIYMVRKMMDEVTYQYKDGNNILTIKKNKIT